MCAPRGRRYDRSAAPGDCPAEARSTRACRVPSPRSLGHPPGPRRAAARRQWGNVGGHRAQPQPHSGLACGTTPRAHGGVGWGERGSGGPGPCPWGPPAAAAKPTSLGALAPATSMSSNNVRSMVLWGFEPRPPQKAAPEGGLLAAIGGKSRGVEPLLAASGRLGFVQSRYRAMYRTQRGDSALWPVRKEEKARGLDSPNPDGMGISPTHPRTRISKAGLQSRTSFSSYARD